MPLRALLTLLLALLAVVSSAVPVELCAAKPGVCLCCENPARVCCSESNHTGALTDRTASAPVDLKLAAAPLLLVMPSVCTEAASLVYPRVSVRLPAASRFEKLCVRLI